MTGVITIISAGTGTGPFYIYSDVDGFVMPFASAISKAALLSGYPTDQIPDGTTIVRVKSLNSECNNYVDIDVYPTTTTTTTGSEFNSYIYDVTGYGCVGCSPFYGTDFLHNSEPLTVGNWYELDLGALLSLHIISFIGGSMDVPLDNISDIDGVASCELLPCNSETTTTTTTICELGSHPYPIYLGFRTAIYGVDENTFYHTFEEACIASSCLTSVGGCGISGVFNVHSDYAVLNIGDTLYMYNSGCDSSGVTGYFIQNFAPTVIIEIVFGVVTNFLDCSSTTTTTTTTTIP